MNSDLLIGDEIGADQQERPVSASFQHNDHHTLIHAEKTEVLRVVRVISRANSGQPLRQK